MSRKPTNKPTLYRAIWRHEYLCSTTIESDLHAIFDLVIRFGRKPDELTEIENDTRQPIHR